MYRSKEKHEPGDCERRLEVRNQAYKMWLTTPAKNDILITLHLEARHSTFPALFTTSNDSCKSPRPLLHLPSFAHDAGSAMMLKHHLGSSYSLPVKDTQSVTVSALQGWVCFSTSYFLFYLKTIYNWCELAENLVCFLVVFELCSDQVCKVT